MTVKEIQELIKLVNKLELTEFKMRDGDFELSVRTKNYTRDTTPAGVPAGNPQPIISVPPVHQPYAPPAPAPPTTPAAPPEDPAAPRAASDNAADDQDNSNYLEVKSPIVGTFYRAPSPDKAPFVKVGDAIEKGQTVCIIEAMKLFNEIESEISGKIVKVMVEDAQPVEYDQVLFLVDPNG